MIIIIKKLLITTMLIIISYLFYEIVDFIWSITLPPDIIYRPSIFAKIAMGFTMLIAIFIFLIIFVIVPFIFIINTIYNITKKNNEITEETIVKNQIKQKVEFCKEQYNRKS